MGLDSSSITPSLKIKAQDNKIYATQHQPQENIEAFH